MNYKHPTLTIEVPVPGRYQITGIQAPSSYIEDYGWLAPPQIVDLPMTNDLADALRAVLDDFQPPAKAIAKAEQLPATLSLPAKKVIRRKAKPRAKVAMVSHESVAQGGAA